jgi:serine phosphatase RsbU (regulator of sigma subunit)/anti-sigma regulatory factor (Ser/Thr protein kinase)/DNA-binding response OmpR family regulator
MLELERRNLRPAIIAMTGSGSESIAVDFMRGGATDYLIKSQITAKNLCAAIRTQLASADARRQILLDSDRGRELNVVLSAELERAAFLVEMERRFAGVLDYDAVLNVATSAAVPFLADVCVVDLINEGALFRRSANSDGNPDSQRRNDAPSMTAAALRLNTAAADALRTGTPIYLGGQAFLDAASKSSDIEAFAQAGIIALAIVPLRISQLSMGAITFGTRSADQFGFADRTIFEDYARRVAAALTNARNVASDIVLRERDDAAQRRLAFSHRISSLIADSPDWQTTLPTLMKALTYSFNDSAAIFSVEQSTNRIRLIAAASQTPEREDLVSRYFVDHRPLIDDRLRSGRATRIEARKPLPSRANGGKTAYSPVSEICVPLLAKGVIVGLLSLLRDRSETIYDLEDLAVATRVGRQVSTHLENARRFKHERGIAQALQLPLLPPELPSVPQLRFAVRYFAGADGVDVGGDWYDVVDVSPQRMVLTIGDVIGTGINAAVAMGQYREVLRAYAFESLSPAAVLTRLNDLVNAQGGEQFATCVLLMLDREARRIDYASAGHPPPMLRLAGGEVRVLDGARAMPIGAWRGTQYVEASVEMPVGSTLVLYTDGLVETRERSASDGVDLLKAALERSRSNVEQMLEDVLRDLAPSRSDDIAILAIEMRLSTSPQHKGWAYQRIDRGTVSTIRAEFDAILALHAAPGSPSFGARVILDELLANIVQHAPGAFRLQLDWVGDNATLRIDDNGPGFALGREFSAPGDPLSTSGRGLFLVNTLGQNLKIVRRPAGGLSISVGLPVDRAPHAASTAVLAPA